MTTTYTFHITGMRCPSCVATVESELARVHAVEKVSASLADQRVRIVADLQGKSIEQFAEELAPILETHGYGLAVAKAPAPATNWSDFRYAVPLACAFIAVFVGLHFLGVVNWVATGSSIGLGTAFLIGVIASLSSCMAIVGGLLLSVSANFAKGGRGLAPQLMFHVGRLLSFFVLGGVIGAAGSVFRFDDRSTFILELVIMTTMLLLGLNLLDLFPGIRRLQPALPAFLGRRVMGLKKLNHTATPFLLGVATFFLPCGFTQSMQLYSITTGHFLTGALIMLSFALGTLPILSILSFSSLGVMKGAGSGRFFKAVGLVVIFMAAFNLVNACVGVGMFSSTDGSRSAASPPAIGAAQASNSGRQLIEITAKGGYSPSSSHARAGEPLTLRIKTNGTFDCSAAVRIASLGWSRNLGASAQVDVQIPSQKPGTTLEGMCSMGMYDFKIKFDQDQGR